jgi:hypothetical protein
MKTVSSVFRRIMAVSVLNCHATPRAIIAHSGVKYYLPERIGWEKKMKGT